MSARKMIAIVLAAVLALTALPAVAEDAMADYQKLDASYTLALNAINAENYEVAKEYLDICFVYCDPRENPTMYADLLLKRACINVIEEKDDMAVLLLDAALRVNPDLADAYLVLTQINTTRGEIEPAVENLEKYIELTGDTSLYETVAQLQEAAGNIDAAQAAYDKFAHGAGNEVKEAGFQYGLYRMQAGSFEEAITAFEAYADDETYAAGAQYNIGVCRKNLGDYAGAVDAFTACEEKGGTFSGLYYNRGICFLLQENWANGELDFAKSIETEPFVDDARYDLGICQMQQEKHAEAVATFDELIRSMTPAEGEESTLNDAVYYFRAICNAALGNPEAAIQDLTTCIDHGYELGQTYYQRAQVYAAMGDKENQTSDLENSLKYTK